MHRVRYLPMPRSRTDKRYLYGDYPQMAKAIEESCDAQEREGFVLVSSIPHTHNGTSEGAWLVFRKPN